MKHHGQDCPLARVRAIRFAIENEIRRLQDTLLDGAFSEMHAQVICHPDAGDCVYEMKGTE